jgi:hypothetical protein
MEGQDRKLISLRKWKPVLAARRLIVESIVRFAERAALIIRAEITRTGI